MRRSVRWFVAALSGTAFLSATAIQAQDTAKVPAGTAPPAASAVSPDPAALAKLAEPVATVNGDTVTRGEVIQLLRQYPIPTGGEQRYYEGAVELLANSRLLSQFLNAQRVAVPQSEVDAQISEQQKVLAQNNSSLEAALMESGTSLEKLKDEIRRTLQWRKYVLDKATDAELKKYLDQNKAAFDGSQIRASHILLSVEPDASEDLKEKARQKAAAIKKEIEEGKLTFQEAANKHSEDPANKEQPNGGDLGVFPRKGKYLEDFAAAAFALPRVGAISDPVMTEYGCHLIQLTARKEGEPVNFDQVKDRVLSQYAVDLQANIVAEERKKAKIELKPMPVDFFAKPAPAPVVAPGGAPAESPASKAKAAEPGTPKGS
jgi:parvulin-like peptidyl-prolyl isomerase